MVSHKNSKSPLLEEPFTTGFEGFLSSCRSNGCWKLLIPLCILNILYLFLGSCLQPQEPPNILRLIARERPPICEFPKLEPFAPEMIRYIKKSKVARCLKQIFVPQKGKSVLNVKGHLPGKCCYRGIPRTTCHTIHLNETEVKIPETEEYQFVEILCKGQKGGVTFRDGFPFVGHSLNVAKKRIKDEHLPKGKSSERLNVVVLGLDNTSKMNFIRQLPKSNEYLMKKLSAIVANGYTKVADNTLPNVIPLLTGMNLKTFQTKCGSNTFAHLDECPFIWKRFKSQGYLTAFAEDYMGIAIFNLNWVKPFTRDPTDFFIHPFAKHMETKKIGENPKCYGSRLSFQVMLDNIQDFAMLKSHKNSNPPFFHFSWNTHLSHDDFNDLRQGDTHLLQFLKEMHSSQALNNTALLIIGDHGSRLPDVQMTRQGKLETRLPLLLFVLPPWLKQKYPQSMINLEQNLASRVTSPFDVHETLKDLMELERLENNYFKIGAIGSSLFSKLSQFRTCLDCGISAHWCVCNGNQDEIKYESNQTEVKNAVESAIKYMNDYLSPVKELCATLKLDKIHSAFELSGGNAIRVYFTVKPSAGFFVGTLAKHGSNWTMTDDVSRLNHYGQQSHCVVQEYRFYCYCHSQYS